MQLPPARRSGRLAVAVSTAMLISLVPLTSAQAVTASPAAASPPAPATAATRTVTLITGDRVTVTPGPNGAPGSTSVQRPPGAVGSVRTVTEAADTYVYPDGALPYIAAGVLDKRLFNVTQLIADGYDDRRTPQLPLIVTHKKGEGALRKGSALPGAEVGRELSSVNGQMVAADRGKAAGLWTALTGAADPVSAQRTSAGELGTRPRRRSPRGVDKVWLDGKAKAMLADSTAQIGAPQAWNAGITGSGVRVAVLDTGVDTGHPDLDQRIVATESFIPGEDVTDRKGHGTHVASTVAGTGAASQGKEQGVAPGADLIVGKVLDNTGGRIRLRDHRGHGMGRQNPARQNHQHEPGTPGPIRRRRPAEPEPQHPERADRCALRRGGRQLRARPNAITAPAAAEAALAVGAVDSSDQLAEFSSVGPRAGRRRVKPDLTAPGVDILAARSQYTPGEGYYWNDSGTSMAAPHVTGAAVLLAQEHPDWSGQQIKDALMSSSRPTPALTGYQGGSGRVDVAAAVRTRVFATGSTFATLPTSNGSQPVERKITYTNTGDTAVTLNLSVDQGQASATTFTLPSDQVTVPAHGSSSATLLISRDGLAEGSYTGQVVARDAEGAIAAHTVVGAGVERALYTMRLTVKDRTGLAMEESSRSSGHTVEATSTTTWFLRPGR